MKDFILRMRKYFRIYNDIHSLLYDNDFQVKEAAL